MISIVNGLRISTANLDALRSGTIVGAFSKTFLTIDRAFALYPDLQTENSDLITLDLWAECKGCESIDNTFDQIKLSQLTGFSTEELESIFQQRASIFLLVLRVYKLPNPIRVQQQTTGNFIPLTEIVTISDKIPILDDDQFQQIQEQSKDLELLIISNLPDIVLDDKDFLRINPTIQSQETIDKENQPNNSLSWIKTISILGDRSIETEDTGKNNWQAGTDFENIVRKALEFLGFKADYAHKGGAGGLDLLCLEPYALFGECKAGKKIPNDTAVQLLNLGTLRRKDLFPKAVKLIIGAGRPTTQLEDAAKAHGMAIINAVTLQKLVELKAKYDAAVNLFELKEYLQAGQIDNKIDEYIQKVEGEIKLRSHIVQTVREEQEVSVTEIRSTYNAKYVTDRRQRLDDSVMKEILIELSSPLAGYLGRVKGDEKKGDRFYYLRDLVIDNEKLN